MIIIVYPDGKTKGYNLGEIETRIVNMVASRLEAGAKTYGVMQREDSRNMLREAVEEAADQSVYLLWRLFQLCESEVK